MDIYQHVEAYISRYGLLQPGETVIVGVSGGADSLTLLDCLHNLGYPLVLAHLDHRLRPESWDEAEFVLGIARRYGVPGVVEREDVRARARRGGSLEEVARQCRYRFLARIAQEYGAGVIATGHTADDQVETILMHLLRGAGPMGLRGILPVTSLASWAGFEGARHLRLVRPLLELTHEETLDHCRELGLEPRQDPSNLDRNFFRNRLRHDLLPILETYNPRARQVLRRTGEVMAAVSDFLQEETARRWGRIVRGAGDQALALHREALLSEPVAMQRSLLRSAIHRLRPSLRDIGFEAVERARIFIAQAGEGARMTLTAGLDLTRAGEEMVLRAAGAAVAFPQYPQLLSDRRRPVRIPGRMRLAAGWRILAEEMELPTGWRRLLREAPNGTLALLDAERLQRKLTLRPPRAGDRFQPLGMQGKVKVSDFFINRHIPRLARARWPLLTAGDQVVWVLGLEIGHAYRVGRGTKRVVVLRLLGPREGSA